MKFEKILLTSFNANHEYIICGSCKFDFEKGKLQLTALLNEAINLSDEICTIEINGIEFQCSSIQIDRYIIDATIKSIDSQVYTRQLNH